MRTTILLFATLALSGCIKVSMTTSAQQAALEAHYWECGAQGTQQLLRAAGNRYTMRANILPSEGNLGARYTVQGHYYFEGEVLMTQAISYSNPLYYNGSSFGALSAVRLQKLEAILVANAFGAQTIELSEDEALMTLVSDVVTSCTIPSVERLENVWGIVSL